MSARAAPSSYWLQGFAENAPDDDARETHAWYKTLLRPYVEPDSRSILDVGCGGGRVLRALLELAPDSRCVGVDGRDETLARAARAFADGARRPALERVDVTETDFSLDLAARYGPFDLITSFFVLHHYPPPKAGAILAELARTLAPGGVILLAETHDPSDSDAAVAEEICADLKRLAGEPPDRLWSVEELRQACAAGGFRGERASFQVAPGRPFNAREAAENEAALERLQALVDASEDVPPLDELRRVVARMRKRRIARPARYGLLLAALGRIA